MCRATDGPSPPGLTSCRAALVYEGPARDLIAALKFRDGRAALPWMADLLADVWREAPFPIEVITWVPARKGHGRGFDQSAALARALGRRLDTPARRLLVREAGEAQTGRGLVARHDGPRVQARRSVPGSILLVDDVWTSGSSLAGCASALRARGGTTVHGLTVGRTLLKPPLSVTETVRDAYDPIS